MAAVVPIGQQRPMLEYALAYAAIGWAVFPVHWVEQSVDKATGEITNRCSCKSASCDRSGKHPLTGRGFQDATTEPESIRGWWKTWPMANIGVSTGAQCWVLDIDFRSDKNGHLTVEALEREHGLLPETQTARSQSGGRHYFFAGDASVQCSKEKVGPGVDVRGTGGYIIVEPSRIDGTYAFDDWDVLAGERPNLAAAPGWLLDLVAGTPRAVNSAPIGERFAPPETLDDLRAALAWLDCSNYQSWIDIGHALKPLGDYGFWLWDEWSRPYPGYNFQQIRQKWHSFKPNNINYESIFARAAARGWQNPRSKGTSAPPPEPETGLLLDLGQLRAASGSVRWLIKHLLPADSVGVAFGASGTFKSFIALDMALHAAHGLAWCGKKTAKQGVVYVAGEGGAGLWNRIDAWHRVRGLGPPEHFRVCIHALLLDNAQHSTALRKEIEALPFVPGLIVVDTQSQTFAGDENSATEVAGYYRRLSADLRAPFGAAVLVIHHTGHAVMERPRGSSAILANVDVVFSLARESELGMSAVLEVRKQKDGDRLEPMAFELERVVLGHDEDGEEVSSLVASYRELVDIDALVATSGARESVYEKAVLGAFGTSKEQHEGVLRAAVYDAAGDEAGASAKRVAFHRVMRALQQKGRIEATAKGVWGLK